MGIEAFLARFLLVLNKCILASDSSDLYVSFPIKTILIMNLLFIGSLVSQQIFMNCPPPIRE